MWRAARLYAAAPRTSSATANPNTSAGPCLEWGFSPGSLLPSSPRSSTPGCRTIRRLRSCWPGPLRCPPSPRWSWTHLRRQPVRPATAAGWVRIPLNLWKWRRRRGRTKPLGWREHWSTRRRKAESPWFSWPALVRAACRRQKPLTCSCHCWRRGAAYDTIPACRFVRLCQSIVEIRPVCRVANDCVQFRWTAATALPRPARPALSTDSAQTRSPSG